MSISSVIGLRIKNAIKGTTIGKKARDTWQRRNFNEDAAMSEIARFQKAGVGITVTDKLLKDMMHEAKDNSVGFDEYLMYHFADLPEYRRREFVPTRERITICEKFNGTKNMYIYDDKAETYKRFKKYYHRDFLNCSGAYTKKDDFVTFTKKHTRFIVKPFAGANGIGIQIIDSTGKDTSNLFEELSRKYNKGFYAEELIKQSDEIGKFHPSSVNTLRVFTIRMNDRTVVLPAAWRIGQGGNIVDNGGSGGIFCVLDDNGVCYGASDKFGRRFEKHPNTGLSLVGTQFPHYHEGIIFAKELAEIIPENRYTGWDLALTDNGWIMQEANDRGGVVAIQLPMERGVRKELTELLNELGL